MTLLRFWLAVAVIACALFLGSTPLLDADEGRNGEVGREMAATNDYVMPRFNGLPYLDKPVVYFAAEAAVMEVLGATELAARLPAYLFTIATAAVLFWFARRLWGSEEGYVAAIVFLTIPMTVAFARTVIFDSALTFFIVVALVAYWFAIEERNARWSILAWAAMGLAMITKGPVTFLLVLGVAVPFAWRRRALRLLFPLLGLAAFAAVCVPWVIGVTKVVPEFLEYVLVTETAARMATDELKRTGPPWYFLPYMLGGALPWSIVLLASAKQLRRRGDATIYLLLWLLLPLIFFSISQSKRPQYVVPLMPPMALLVAQIWREARTRVAASVLLLCGAVLLAAPLLLPRIRMQAEVRATADETALVLGIAFTLGALVALFTRRRELIFVALSLPVIVLPAAATPLLAGLAERRSAHQFIAELKPHLTPQMEVIGIEAFTGSMQFYLGRRITLLTEDASEMTSNYLIRRYERYARDPRSPLKPLTQLGASLAATHPRVYVVRAKDTRWRTLLESHGWRKVADGGHHIAYGR